MATKEKVQEPVNDDIPETRNCATDEVNDRLIRTVDGYAEARAEIENRTYRVLESGAALRTGCTEIPVVVHVVYRTAAENVSDEQVKSQITVLNADYRAANPDKSSTPAVFQSLIGDARMTFRLATTDPSGNPTDGITRTSTTTTPFVSSTDNVKSASTGGADAWPSDRYLNLWVCGNLRSGTGQALLGYAQFPGGPSATDGVVILYSGFGTTGSAAAPFNLGRTATHEVGHWLNLRHIWGDDGTGCAGSDFVADTPNQGGPNYGAPSFPTVSCSNGPNGDLFMNYMDYTDDHAMVMFTGGQVDRMQAALDGPRSSIGVSRPCEGKTIKEHGKDLIKDRPKDLIKENPKDLIKDNPKDFVKDRPKDLIKDAPKDGVKERPKDLIKDHPKDLIKDRPKDGVKERPKDLIKDRAKDFTKDLADDLPKQLRDPVKNIGAEVGPLDPGPYVDPLNPGQYLPQQVGGVTGGVPFVLGTGRGGDDEWTQSDQAHQPSEQDELMAVIQHFEGILSTYANSAQTGQLGQAELARWQQLATVYAQIIALIG